MKFLSKNHGFTLQEILVAVAIMGIVLLMANRFLNTSSRQSRILATKTDSDMQYNLFKTQLQKDLSNATGIILTQGNPYTFTIKTYNVETDTESSIIYTGDDCFSSSVNAGLPNYVRVALGTFTNNPQQRLLAIVQGVNDTVRNWITNDYVAPAQECSSNVNSDELSRVVRRVVRSDGSGTNRVYPLENTPASYVDNGGIISSRLYITNPNNNEYYVHIFTASLSPRADDNSDISGINWNDMVRVSHDFVKINLNSVSVTNNITGSTCVGDSCNTCEGDSCNSCEGDSCPNPEPGCYTDLALHICADDDLSDHPKECRQRVGNEITIGGDIWHVCEGKDTEFIPFAKVTISIYCNGEEVDRYDRMAESVGKLQSPDFNGNETSYHPSKPGTYRILIEYKGTGKYHSAKRERSDIIIYQP